MDYKSFDTSGYRRSQRRTKRTTSFWKRKTRKAKGGIFHELSRSNRDKFQQFLAITGASEKSALQALKAKDCHLEAAFDVFYNQPQPRCNAADIRRLEKLDNRYKGGTPRHCHGTLKMKLFNSRANIWGCTLVCTIHWWSQEAPIVTDLELLLFDRTRLQD